MKTHRVPPGTMLGQQPTEESPPSVGAEPDPGKPTFALEALYDEAATALEEKYARRDDGSANRSRARPTRPGALGPSALDDLDRWLGSLGSRKLGTREIQQAPLRERAEYLPPRPVHGTAVSAFSDWVLRLHGVSPSVQAKRRGITAEDSVQWSRVPLPHSQQWELIHNGMNGGPHRMRGSGAGSTVPFLISALQLGGAPFFGSPDLVFRRRNASGMGDRENSAIAILEVKCTDAEIPTGLWPNVRAQLWAYSKIDAFQNAEEIYLIGEVWSAHGTRRRRTFAWKRSESELEDECTELFDLYCNSTKVASR